MEDAAAVVLTVVDVSTGLMLVFATSLCKECGIKLCGQDRGQLHCPTGTDGEPVIEQVMNTLSKMKEEGTKVRSSLGELIQSTLKEIFDIEISPWMTVWPWEVRHAEQVWQKTLGKDNL